MNVLDPHSDIISADDATYDPGVHPDGLHWKPVLAGAIFRHGATLVVLPLVLHWTVESGGYLLPFLIATAVAYLIYDRIYFRLLDTAATVLANRVAGNRLLWALFGPLCIARSEGNLIYRVDRRWMKWSGNAIAYGVTLTDAALVRLVRRTTWLSMLYASVFTLLLAAGMIAVALATNSTLLLILAAPFATLTVSTLVPGAVMMRAKIHSNFDHPLPRSQIILAMRLSGSLYAGVRVEDLDPSLFETLDRLPRVTHHGIPALLTAWGWALERGDVARARGYLARALEVARPDVPGSYVPLMYESAFFAAAYEDDPATARFYLAQTTTPAIEAHIEDRVAAAIARAEGVDGRALEAARQGLDRLSPILNPLAAAISERYLTALIESLPAESRDPEAPADAEHAQVEAGDSHREPALETGLENDWLPGSRGLGIGEQQAGLRPREYNPELIERQVREGQGTERETLGLLRKYRRLFDMGDVDEAERALDTAIALSRISWQSTPTVRYEAAFLSAYIKRDPVSARAFLRSASRRQIPAHTLARVDAAILFAEGNLAEAHQEAKRGLEQARGASDPGLAAFDVELMEHIIAAAMLQEQVVGVGAL